MADISFTPEQVEAAIRHGMRGDRRRYEFGPGDAEQKNVTYGSNLAHYRSVAQKCLDEGDYLQAAEKSWGAYAQTIKATCAALGIRVSTHANILSVAQSLTMLAGNADPVTGDRLLTALHTARSLHQHFYEDELADAVVERAVGEVMDAIDLLQTLFDGNSAEGIG